MARRASSRKPFLGVLVLGGVAVACGTASDLDVTQAGSGGSGRASRSTVGGKASLVVGIGPIATGGAAGTCGPTGAPCSPGMACPGPTYSCRCLPSGTYQCVGGIGGAAMATGGTVSVTGGTPAATGGTSSGGVPSGGKATGGIATGGTASGGKATGGTGARTLAQACNALCTVIQDASLSACSYTTSECNTGCTGYMDAPIDPDNYPPMVQCLATLTATQWECGLAPPDDGIMFGAIPAFNGPCEDEVCAWTCTDGTLVDVTAYNRCNC